MGDRTLTVEATVPLGGIRLDAFLHRALPGLSRRVLRRTITEGVVRVNGRPAVKGLRLRVGDAVTIPDLAPGIRPDATPALPILYEDAWLVAIEKPGGMAGHAVDPRERGTAAAFLLARHPEMAAVGDPLGPGLVHRLDIGTSGVLLAARTAAAHGALRAALRARAVEKTYLAVVAGAAPELEGRRITAALAHDPRDRRRMVVAPPGIRAWPAETALAVEAVGRATTLLRATIRTGVTHQVRAHLALAGHPVLNDLLYGGPAAALGARRHALHATRVMLPHPATGATLTIVSPLAPDLTPLLGV